MDSPENSLTRRQFIKRSGRTLVKVGLPGTFAVMSQARLKVYASERRPDGRSRIPPGQIAVEYLKQMGGEPGPGLDPDWELRITGEAGGKTAFTWDDLMHLPQVDLVCDVHCVTGWTLLDSGWQGIRLKTLMDECRVTSKANFIIFQAHGGYTTNIPVSEGIKENVILAHSFDGRPLPQPHGAPLRALVPDRYFYKSAKWITGIRFSAVDEPGFWESGGYSNSADPWKEERFEE